MPRGAEISSVEREFIRNALIQGTRLDGRHSLQTRTLDLNFGDDYGTAMVNLGNTRVYAQISAEVTKPSEERKFDGIFTITTELSPIASVSFETGRQSDSEVVLSRILEKAIRRSNAIDTESLCIVAGAKCWSVRADVHILDADGGLVDAACIAIMAALQHFRRPDVSVDGEQVTFHTMAERVPVPLSIMHHPVCTTFNFLHNDDNEEVLFVDATSQEEQIRESDLILTTNDFELCQMAKLGGASVDAMTLLKCSAVALERSREVNRLISKKLTEDATRRDVGGLIAELRAENNR